MPSTSRVVQAAPGPMPTRIAGRALGHELGGGLAAHRVADQDRQMQRPGQVGEGQDPAGGRDVLGARDLGLDDEDVRAGRGRDLGVIPGRRRGGGHRGHAARRP